MSKKKPDEITRFKEWVSARGAAVLVETSEWELARFKADGITSIIYRNQKDVRSYTGQAEAAMSAFRRGDNSWRAGVVRDESTKTGRHRSVEIRTIVERDGDVCFYCAADFGKTGEQRTREHLVATTHGGPNHISNMFLSCHDCNGKAGHLSAPEKIRMRDRMRRGRGSKLLARAYDRMMGGEGDPPLFDEILTFLHESKPKENGPCLENLTAKTPRAWSTPSTLREPRP